MSEEVMVVKTSDVAPFLAGRTFDIIRDRAEEMLALIAEKHFFIPRERAEVSPEFRQVIPYVVITHGDRVFTTRRLRKQTEVRLHDKVSIGIGGHVNPGHDLAAGLQKELDEEVAIDDPYELAFEGILNDESTEVSRVHLGAVYTLRASSDRVRIRETEKLTGEWLTRAQLREVREAMESWSVIAFEAISVASMDRDQARR